MSASPLAGLQALERFHYDAMDRVTTRLPASGAATRTFYQDMDVASTVTGTEQRGHVQAGDHLLGVCDKASGGSTTTLLGTQQQGSVLRTVAPGATGKVAYTPYGEGANPLMPGFNGQLAQPSTGYYLLGNGYRAYNPGLMRFNSPDSFSPFDGGGLNPYTYCLGDPINRTDPTGHMSSGAWIGVGFGVLAVIVGIVTIGVVAAPFVAAAVAGLAMPALTVGAAAALVAGVLLIASGGVGIAAAGLREKDPYSDFAGNLSNVSLGLGLGAAAIGVGTTLYQAVGKAMASALDAYMASGSVSRAFATANARAAGALGTAARWTGFATRMLTANEAMAANVGFAPVGAQLLQPLARLARSVNSLVTQLRNPRVVSAAKHFARALTSNLTPRLPGFGRSAGAEASEVSQAPVAPPASPSTSAARIRT